MKKNYFFKTSLLMIPTMAFLLMSNSSGKSGAFSGSPGDGGTSCTACHSGGNFGASAHHPKVVWPDATHEQGVECHYHSANSPRLFAKPSLVNEGAIHRRNYGKHNHQDVSSCQNNIIYRIGGTI